MPFGLQDAPAAFQRMMITLLGDLMLAKICLDGAIALSKSLGEHLNHLSQALKMLDSHGLKLNIKKCSLLGKGRRRWVMRHARRALKWISYSHR